MPIGTAEAMMANLNDQEIRQAAAGDEAALELLLLDHYDQLLLHISHRIDPKYRSDLSTEDVAQETFIHVCRDIAGYSPSGSFEAWLYKIAENRLRDAIKALNRKKRPPPKARVVAVDADASRSFLDLFDIIAGQEPTPSGNMRQDERIRAVRVALAELPDEHRRIVQLRYIDGLPVAEVAKAVGKTEQAVHGICKRAKERMHECLGRSSMYFSSR